MINAEILKRLNAGSAEERLEALKEELKTADFPKPVPRYINNHIHTTYSFSPYSPTAAVYAARAEGLSTAGIIDHDSIAGAREFLAAAEIAGIPATVGMECRVSFAGTPFEKLRTNNPDQVGVSYMTLQSVSHEHIEELNEFFAPYRKEREKRTRAMTGRINNILEKDGIYLDFERDVLGASEYSGGGGLTERHMMFALAEKLTEKFGRGEGVKRFMAEQGIALSEKQVRQLEDTSYAFYEYDVLGILKSAFIPKIFIPADEECPRLSEIVAEAERCDALLCYAYLGDITSSVTGDKKAQKFEDEHIDELFECLNAYGIRAITYMPTRNTGEQLVRIRALCDKYGMLQVCGEDINSPRQSFVVRAMDNPEFANLIDSTWRLIDHEKKGKPFFDEKNL